ncbi:UNVERIFIED_CONTAM: Peregrinol diphosphate synthase TPS1, chloroplastic [Sesamum calycinum]|uniref:Peregrinol diphosphate synthase TPS1, chloroplastic n=1 Tax=Sesamum calycinum TaxID=2727403 RepID=A0AAW2LV87_9LAMI
MFHWSKGILPSCKARLTPISRVTTNRVDLAVVGDAQKEDPAGEALAVVGTLEGLTEYIKKFLSSMDEGRINVSPYDTAWVALIRDINGEDSPQFPASLEWIAQNQLHDGSWGEQYVFSAYDRLLNTLACVVALRSWNVHPHKSEKGIAFIKEKIHKLEHANAENMTSGFEIVFPALLQRARHIGIHDLPYDAPVLQDIMLQEIINWRAPNVYPIDIFVRLWGVDRLTRLGISRLFESEIKNCLEYVHRTPEINNDAYLELAKLDFNRCQAQHQTEWNHMQEWYENSNLQELGISKKDVLVAHFLASASAFEPERSKERSAWAKTRIISKIITSYFNRETTSSEEKAAFLAEFRHSSISDQPKTNSVGGRIIDILRQTLQQLQEGIDKTLCNELENATSAQELCINAENGSVKHMGMEEDMQKLVQLVHEEPTGIDKDIKQTFLLVAKALYYDAYFPAQTVDIHMSKVLFLPVP